jgi:site-specific recombinase XerD
MRYPADPPTIEEIVAVMRVAGERPDGLRLRALIVLLWRAGLRIGEALALAETDLNRSRGAVLVRRGKGGKRREAGRTAGPRARLVREFCRSRRETLRILGEAS